MKGLLKEQIERISRDHQRTKKITALFLVLAIVATLGVNWGLSRPGVAMSDVDDVAYFCGNEEHQHDETCYTQILTCELEETEPVEGHTHTEECYESQTTMVCAEDEHTHGEGCYDEEGNLTCELSEHTHSDACYVTEQVLSCGLEETEAVEGHTHTEECYTTELTCELPEHTHVLQCRSDSTADVETASTWESTLPSLSGDWAQDLVKVAKSQLGYHESTRNFQVQEDGETKKGYTRYGAWYGYPYDDWCAMFASFCLHYANIPTSVMPINASCSSWISDLKSSGLYQSRGEYQPKAGDLVFFSGDHVGIVTKVSADDNGNVTKIYTIEGNSANAVKEDSYASGDSSILGYGVLHNNTPEATEEATKEPEVTEIPEPTAEATEAPEVIETPAAIEEATEEPEVTEMLEATEEAEDSETFGEIDLDEEMSEAKTSDIVFFDVNEDDVNDSAGNSFGVNLYDYVKSVTLYRKKDNDGFTSSTNFKLSDTVRAHITFDMVNTDLIKANNYRMYLDLPKQMDLSLFNSVYPLLNSNNRYVQVGTYYFTENDNGTYRLFIDIKKDSIVQYGTELGYTTIKFEYNWQLDDIEDEGGDTVVKIGNRDVPITITRDDITYEIEKNYSGRVWSEDAQDCYYTYNIKLRVNTDVDAPIRLHDEFSVIGEQSGENRTAKYQYAYELGVTIDAEGLSAEFDNKEDASTDILINSNNGTTIPAGEYVIEYKLFSRDQLNDNDNADIISNEVSVGSGIDKNVAECVSKIPISADFNKTSTSVGDGTYKYIITINCKNISSDTLPQYIQNGISVTDTLPDELELVSDVVVEQRDIRDKLLYTTTATVDGQRITYTCPPGRYYYRIIYTAKLTSAAQEKSGVFYIQNEAVLTGDVNKTLSRTIAVDNSILDKKLESSNKVTVYDEESNSSQVENSRQKWSVTFKVDGKISDYVFEDWSGLGMIDVYDESTGEITTQYGALLRRDTSQKVSVYYTNTNGNESALPLGTYSLSESDHTENEVKNGLLKVVFNSDYVYKGEIRIVYYTLTNTYYRRDVKTDFYNYCSLSRNGAVIAEDYVKFTETFPKTERKNSYYLDKSSGDGSKSVQLNPDENRLDWKVKVHPNPNFDVVFEDTLDEGLVFLPDTLKIFDYNGQELSDDFWGCKIEFSEDNRTLNIKISKDCYLVATDVTITYQTEITDSGSFINKEYSNKARLKYGTYVTYVSDFTQTVTRIDGQRDFVQKSGHYTNLNHTLTYDIVVNPEAMSLSTANGYIEVIDTLDVGVVNDYVVLKSVKAYAVAENVDSSGNTTVAPGKLMCSLEQTNSVKVYGFRYDKSTRTLRAYLTDETPLVLVVEYCINIDADGTLPVKNSVYINGYSEWKYEDSTSMEMSETHGSTWTSYNTLQVRKHDADNDGVLLSGATFKLEKYNVRTGWETVESATTEKDGKAFWSGIEYKILYRLTETKAPDGYFLDDEPNYFMFVRESDLKHAKAYLPKTTEYGDYSKDKVTIYTVKDDDVDIDGKTLQYGLTYRINQIIERYNTKDTTTPNPGKLSVSKTWLDVNGDVVTDTSTKPEVLVTLTKHVPKDGKTVTIQSSDSSTTSVTLSDLADGCYLYAYMSSKVNQPDASTFSCTDSGVTLADMGASDGVHIWKIGPITQDCTIVQGALGAMSAEGYLALGGTMGETQDTVVSTIALNNDNGWTYTWTNLDRSSCTYSIAEVDVMGYTASYKVDDADLEVGATFTLSESGNRAEIINNVNQYTLPSTGGIGTTILYTLGTILALGAAILFVGKKKPFRMMTLMLVVLMMITSTAALAENTWIDLDAKGSISLTLTDKVKGEPVGGGTVALYKVANVAVDDGNLSFAYTNGFEGCGIDLGTLSDSTLASQLEAKISATASKTAKKVGTNGKVSFTDLDLGLYLLVQTDAASGYNAVSSFLVSVPMTSDGTYTYNVDATPKVEKLTVKPTPTPGVPGGNLPQTGQLDWPIPVLVIAGLLLVTAGWLMMRKREA